MDLMAIRRKMLLASGKKVIDTSPKILQHGARYLTDGSVLTVDDRCITVIYDLDVTINSSNRRGTIYGIVPSLINYTNGAFKYYWDKYSNTKPVNVVIFTVGTNQVAFTLQEDMLDVCYAIHNATGQIIFAGKNSPYYGYTNINDMPSA